MNAVSTIEPEDEDEREFREMTELCERWLKDKSPAHWLWLASHFCGDHGEMYDEKGVRKWLENHPGYPAEDTPGCAPGDVKALHKTIKPYLDPDIWLLYKKQHRLRPDIPKPGTKAWEAWWKKVRGNPERYWANEPAFGYPTTVWGHVLRWGGAAIGLAVMVGGMYLYVRLRMN